MVASWQSRGRKDKTQAEVIEAFEKMGCLVEKIGWPVDLLVCCLSKNILVEVKTQNGQLTTVQQQFFDRWRSPLYVIRSADEAIELVQTLRGKK